MSRESKDLRDFSLSRVPGASSWPPDAIRAIVGRAADVIDELDVEVVRLREALHAAEEAYADYGSNVILDIGGETRYLEEFVREVLDADARRC